MTRPASPSVDSNACNVATETDVTLHALLRLGCALCFVGHGAWGVMTKAGWLPFYAVFGVPASMAWKTMPLVGGVDITLGVLALFRPTRAVLAYMTFWALFTALLRPLAGMGFWEFLERGGNYGPPFALYLLATASGSRWFGRIDPAPIPREASLRAAWALRVSIACLLIGHGGLVGIQAKRVFVEHFHAIGIAATETLLRGFGALEIAAGLAVLLRPSRWLLLCVTFWKLATELLYPIAGSARDVWEWIERGGDYVAPLALICLLFGANIDGFSRLRRLPPKRVVY
ncbi:MAG TPA: hypothetical protein VHC69_29755 [Polyangiaceae bacterium]|nr:hypothetical protein [Polyangiaceae bacterium]